MLLARPQVSEGIEEPGLCIHLPEQFRDTDARHQGVNRPFQARRSGRCDRVMRRNLQSPALNSDTRERIALQGAIHLAQAFGQHGTTIRQPCSRICLEARITHDGLRCIPGHQIAVEPAIFATAIDPNISRAQAIPQGGHNGRFVHAPLWLAVVVNQRRPMLGRERHRRIIGQLAFAGAVLITQQGDCIFEVIPRISCIKLESLQKGRGEPAHIGIALSRQRKRITGCQRPEADNFVTLAQESVPPNVRIQRSKGILPCVLRAGHGINGRAEELHQLANPGLPHTPDLLLTIVGS